MPPKKGKKGKRRGGDSSSDDEGRAAATVVAASIKNAAANDSDDVDGEDATQQRRGNRKGGSKGGLDKDDLASASTAASKNSKKNKKKGKRGKNNDDSDSDDGDALDPLAHLRTGGAGGRGGRGAAYDDDDEEEDRPKKPLTKKEKKRLEEERLRREKAEQQAAADEASSEEEDDETSPAGAEGREGDGVEEASVQVSKSSEKDKKNRKGKKGKGADRSDEEGQQEDGGETQKKPPTKKERRRLESQEQRQRELEAEQAAAAAAAAAEAEEASRNDVEKEDSANDAPAASLKKSKKGKKKGKKGRGGGDDDDSDGESEDALSRGMESLSVEAPAATGKKLSKKERRRAESRAAAAVGGGGGEDEGGEEEEDAAAAAVAKEEAAARAIAEATGLEREEKARAERKVAEAAATKADEAKGKGGGSDEEDDGSQKRRMSKKERKKAKQQGGKKKGGADLDPVPMEEAPEPQPPQQPDANEGRTGSASPPPPPSPPTGDATAVEQPADMDVVDDDGGAIERGPSGGTSLVPPSDLVAPPAPAPAPAPAAAPAAPAAPAAVEEVVGTKKPKKEKKSKLMRKLEEAARLKAEAEASVGLAGGGGAVDDEKRAVEEAAAEKKRKEEKKARKAKKEAAKEKDSKVKSILEDLDDAEYYGSDHEERGKGGANGGGAKETVEEELARLVAAAEAGGKTATARQRKKILQDIEARRRAAADEEREELAHREGAQFGCSQTAVGAGDQQWANSLDVTIEAFSISAHDKTLFKDSSLQVVHGRKYGLVGPNGAGKSTLLKMIASGELKIPPRIDCLYVEQEVVADDTPAVIAVMKADRARWSLMEEERRVNRLLRDDPDNEKLNDRLQQVHEELHTSGGDGAEASARRILFGLGFDDVMQVKATKHFSGGWRMRISLARALFMEPTLLMLDEPTNHLDLNAVIWLDDYLQKWKKTLLVVSHDQDFLNSVCEEILHLDHQRVNQYKGNYDQFKEMEAQKRKQQAKEWEKQQRKLASLKKGGQSKGKAEETVKKSKFREPGGSKKKKNDAVASGTGEVEKAQLVERPREYVVTLNFPEVSTLSPPVVEVMDVDFKYSTGPTILKDVNFGLDQASRVCIVGPNGAGKTTLLKLLTGALEPSVGFIRRNPRMRAGIYNQHFVDRLPMDIDPTSYLRSKFSDQCDYQAARNLLGRFGLEGHAHTIKMRDLSGGQKARVVFCELSLQAPHVLFLDEPTNNLDIESIDALCDAVTRFNGGVVVVTHDARLIEATECRLWIVDEQEVTPWQGEFEEYRADLLQKLEEKLAAQEQARIDKTAASS